MIFPRLICDSYNLPSSPFLRVTFVRNLTLSGKPDHSKILKTQRKVS